MVPCCIQRFICAVGLISGFVIRPALADMIQPRETEASIVESQSQLSLNALQYIARNLTVKVFSGEEWGSGILIQRQGQIYTVLTNQHVLQPGHSYRIQMFDGQIYSAVQSELNVRGNDLTVLQFRSPQSIYPVARLGKSSSLNTGEEVVAAGFPSETASFEFTVGKLVTIMQKPLEGGYQFGYTNAIKKGMSGGPVLNFRGELVGVNGMHAEALWGNPYIYQDGSKPCLPMHNLMRQMSWAIPIETVIQIAEIPLSLQSASSISSLVGSTPNVNSDPVYRNYDELLLKARTEDAEQCQPPRLIVPD